MRSFNANFITEKNKRADGPTPIDTLGFGPQLPDTSYARLPDGADYWDFTGDPTPGAPNSAGSTPPVLFINEFLASNDTTNADEAGEYDDWVEIFNPGPPAVNLGGLFLSDDLADKIVAAVSDMFVNA